METFYQSGYLKFYESCMLESIKNAVRKFTLMGILKMETVRISRKESKTLIKVTPEYQDLSKLVELYERIAFYVPYSPISNVEFLHKELRSLTISDVVAKL